VNDPLNNSPRQWGAVHAILFGMATGLSAMYIILATGPGGPTSTQDMSTARWVTAFAVYAVCLVTPLAVALNRIRKR
jgi:hypothetical protein